MLEVEEGGGGGDIEVDGGGGDEEGGFIGWDAHVFLEEGVVVRAGGFDGVEVGGVVHGLDGVILVEFEFKVGEEALVEGVLEGDFMVGDVFWVTAEGNFLDEGVEEVVMRSVGGDDLEVTAPGDAGERGLVEEFWVWVEGEFVEDAGSAFACLGVYGGGEGVYGGVIGEVEGIGGGFKGVVEDGVGEGRGGEVDGGGEFGAILEEEFGLGMVLGGDPGVEFGGSFGVVEDEGEGGGVGDADLAGFFDKFDFGVIVDPF